MNMHVTQSIKNQYRWFGNTLVAFRNPAAEGVDRISVIEHWMPYGEAPPLHIHHNEDEIFQVLEGEMTFEVAGRETICRAGETILAPKGIPHRFRVTSLNGAHCFTITCGTDFESMVLATGRVPDHGGLPAEVAPTPEMIAILTKACAENGIDIIGPPLA